MEDKVSNVVKKILIFSTAYLPLIGGAEIAVKEITDRLGDNFCFDLICARIKKDLPSKEAIGNISVWRVGNGWSRKDKFLLPWQGFKLAKQLHQEKKYDLIWAIMASFGGLTALRFKQRFFQVPYLLTLQEGDAPEHIRSRARWLGPYWRKTFERADLITAISHYLKDYALLNGAKCPIEVVPNGVDLQKFKIQNSKFKVINQNLKSKLGIEENEKVIIHHGRLAVKNGLADLIEAISLLPTIGCHIPLKLLLIGTGEEQQFLEAKVKKLKLENSILFMNTIPNEEIPRYLIIADIFVRPSLSEGLGNSFLEAMAVGVPVIGTPVGGVPDFLKDKETGLLCKVRNPQSIAEKIKILLENSELRQKIINNARKLVREKYDWNLIAQKMKNIFDKLCVS